VNKITPALQVLFLDNHHLLAAETSGLENDTAWGKVMSQLASGLVPTGTFRMAFHPLTLAFVNLLPNILTQLIVTLQSQFTHLGPSLLAAIIPGRRPGMVRPASEGGQRFATCAQVPGSMLRLPCTCDSDIAVYVWNQGPGLTPILPPLDLLCDLDTSLDCFVFSQRAPGRHQAADKHTVTPRTHTAFFITHAWSGATGFLCIL
jgi:hypothetical protein